MQPVSSTTRSLATNLQPSVLWYNGTTSDDEESEESTPDFSAQIVLVSTLVQLGIAFTIYVLVTWALTPEPPVDASVHHKSSTGTGLSDVHALTSPTSSAHSQGCQALPQVAIVTVCPSLNLSLEACVVVESLDLEAAAAFKLQSACPLPALAVDPTTKSEIRHDAVTASLTVTKLSPSPRPVPAKQPGNTASEALRALFQSRASSIAAVTQAASAQEAQAAGAAGTATPMQPPAAVFSASSQSSPASATPRAPLSTFSLDAAPVTGTVQTITDDGLQLYLQQAGDAFESGKYAKMLLVGVPLPAIRQKIAKDGVSLPMPVPSSASEVQEPAPVVVKPVTLAQPPASVPQSAIAKATGDTLSQCSPDIDTEAGLRAWLTAQTPPLDAYVKMMAVGVPHFAVKQKLLKDGIQPYYSDSESHSESYWSVFIQ